MLNIKISPNSIRLIIVVSITALILLFLFINFDFWSVMAALSSANLYYLLFSLLPLGAAILIQTKRWQTVLAAMGYKLPFLVCFYAFMGALPLVLITPSHSGDIVRGYYLRDDVPITRTIGSVLTERIFDLLILLTFSIAGMILYQRNEYAPIIIGVGILVLIIIVLLCSNINIPIVEAKKIAFRNIAFSIKKLIKDKKALLKVFLYSLIMWSLSAAQIILIIYSINIKIPIPFVIGNIFIAILIGMIPISLGGMGTRDAAIVYLFSAYADPAKLLAVGILFSIFRYWLLALLGIPFMKMLIKKDGVKNDKSIETK